MAKKEDKKVVKAEPSKKDVKADNKKVDNKKAEEVKKVEAKIEAPKKESKPKKAKVAKKPGSWSFGASVKHFLLFVIFGLLAALAVCTMIDPTFLGIASENFDGNYQLVFGVIVILASIIALAKFVRGWRRFFGIRKAEWIERCEAKAAKKTAKAKK